jgi:hypothetical protein
VTYRIDPIVQVSVNEHNLHLSVCFTVPLILFSVPFPEDIGDTCPLPALHDCLVPLAAILASQICSKQNDLIFVEFAVLSGVP